MYIKKYKANTRKNKSNKCIKPIQGKIRVIHTKYSTSPIKGKNTGYIYYIYMKQGKYTKININLYI